MDTVDNSRGTTEKQIKCAARAALTSQIQGHIEPNCQVVPFDFVRVDLPENRP